MSILSVTGVLGMTLEDDSVVEVNQSSKNLAAAPLLSPLISLLSLLMEVPCVANQLNAPMLFPLPPSTNFKRVISVSTSVEYCALSSAGLKSDNGIKRLWNKACSSYSVNIILQISPGPCMSRQGLQRQTWAPLDPQPQ